MAAVPEFSRRARGFTVWAALRSLGRDGVAVMVDGLQPGPDGADQGLSRVDGVEIVNDVVFTQVVAVFEKSAPARWPGGCSPTGRPG